MHIKEEIQKVSTYDYLKENNRITVYSPGRVCIIGEHTDYSGGLSMSCAINRYIKITNKEKNNNYIETRSITLKDSFKTKLDLKKPLKPLKDKTWSNYILGVFEEFRKRGYNLTGFNIEIDSNLTTDSGISSSAALELAVAKFIQTINDISLDKKELVEMAHSAENNFVGVSCGYLDQISVAYGRKGYATLIDFENLKVKHIPFDLKDNILLLIDSKQRRNLSGTDYNKRRAECEEAFAIISSSYKKIKNLSGLKSSDLPTLKDLLPANLYKRVRHIISENDRVRKSVKYLKEGDIFSLGKLMFETHRSLRLDFEVSTERLDHIVDTLKDKKGVLGARLMGAGFGGSVISIVKKDSIEKIKRMLSKSYEEKYGITLSFTECLPSEGIRVVFEPFLKEEVTKEDGRYLIYYNFDQGR